MSSTFEKVVEVLKEELGVGVVKSSDTLAGLGADSLDAVEVVMALEEEFDIDIADSEFDQIKTIGDLVSIVETKKGN